MEKIERPPKPTDYKWWKDAKMIGTISLIVTFCLLVFSFVKVPFLSSINGYTVGMLLGVFSPLFYIFVIYKSLIYMFDKKIKLPKWIKLTDVTYWIVVISIVFISSATGFYQAKNGYTSFGIKTWHSFDGWYKEFTGSETVSAWTPNNTIGGVIGVFLYSLSSMLLSGIGSLILAIVMLVISFSILVSGSFIGFYTDLIKRKKTKLNDKEIKETKRSKIKSQGAIEANISNEDNKTVPHQSNNLIINEDIIHDDENKKNDSLPFDDPF